MSTAREITRPRRPISTPRDLPGVLRRTLEPARRQGVHFGPSLTLVTDLAWISGSTELRCTWQARWKRRPASAGSVPQSRGDLNRCTLSRAALIAKERIAGA